MSGTGRPSASRSAASTFGKVDPQFHLDIGFFVFKLPALRMISDWLLSTLVVALVLTLLVHLFDGGIRPAERLRGFDPHVKAHVSVLLGLIVASKAFDYWLSIYELDLSPRGQVLGASLHRRPRADPGVLDPHRDRAGDRAAAAASTSATAAGGSRSSRSACGSARASSSGPCTRGSCRPCRSRRTSSRSRSPTSSATSPERGRRSISQSIDATGFAAAADLTAPDITEATATVKNVRLSDPNVIVDTLQAAAGDPVLLRLQGRGHRPVHHRRADAAGADLGARDEHEPARRPRRRRGSTSTWSYTHGYRRRRQPGERGQPRRAARSSSSRTCRRPRPPTCRSRSPASTSARRPSDYAIVDTTQKEFDYPVGGAERDDRVQAARTASRSGSLLDRLAFAIVTGDVEIALLERDHAARAAILYRRTITDRVQALAPWLKLDGTRTRSSSTDGSCGSSTATRRRATTRTRSRTPTAA